MHWRRKWQPTPVFLPGESQGRGSLVGCCLWGRTESDMTKAPVTGEPSMAERSYPTSEIRGRSQEDPMPKGRQPRGVTPLPRSGTTAESARLPRHRNGQEEPPRIQGQGRQPGGATACPRSGGCVGAGGPRGAIPRSRSGGAAVRRYPSSKVRSSGCTLLEQL